MMCWTDDSASGSDYAQQPLRQPSGSGTGVGPDLRLSVGQEMLVPAPLLQTKFFVPRSRRGLVPRPRLSERLDRGVASTLMIVSAPAGFGKTTLLAEWLAAGSGSPDSERVAAWLALDPGDNDPVTFWTYVVAALQRMAPGVGEDTLTLLHEPQPPPIESVLTTLLNDLGALA